MATTGEPGGLFAGSPFLRDSAALDHRAGGIRTALRDRHDRAAAALRGDDTPALLAATRRLERVLAAARRDLGPRDADTLVVEATLATAYLLGDDETRGRDLLTRNLARRAHVLGDEHPATLAAADALAATHRLTGSPEEAVGRYQDVILRRSRVLGDAHPDTLTSRAGLAVARADCGDLRGATGLLTASLETAERFLGREHAVTATLLALLAECYDALAEESPDGADDPEPATGVLPRAPQVPDPREETRPLYDRPSGPLPVVG